MENKKNILQSKTIWGALVGILGVLINQGVIDFANTEELNQMVGAVSTIAGLVFTMYGRVKAEKKIK